MSSNFRVILKPIALKSDKVESVVLAYVYLQVFLFFFYAEMQFQNLPIPHKEELSRTMMLQM